MELNHDLVDLNCTELQIITKVLIGFNPFPKVERKYFEPIEDPLGVGTIGVVRKVTRRADSRTFAKKVSFNCYHFFPRIISRSQRLRSPKNMPSLCQSIGRSVYPYMAYDSAGKKGLNDYMEFYGFIKMYIFSEVREALLTPAFCTFFGKLSPGI